MGKHTSKAKVADSVDILVGAAMVDAQIWKAYGKPLDPDSRLPAIFERLKAYADNLEAVEKDKDVIIAIETLLDDLTFTDFHPETVQVSWLDLHRVVTVLTDLVPTLSPDKER